MITIDDSVSMNPETFDIVLGVFILGFSYDELHEFLAIFLEHLIHEFVDVLRIVIIKGFSDCGGEVERFHFLALLHSLVHGLEIERENLMFFFDIAEDIFEVLGLEEHVPEFELEDVFLLGEFRLEEFDHLEQFFDEQESYDI